MRAVTQADRDAALGVIMCDSRGRYNIQIGDGDDHPLVQAFARHRERALASHPIGRAEALEEAAKHFEARARHKERIGRKVTAAELQKTADEIRALAHEQPASGEQAQQRTETGE